MTCLNQCYSWGGAMGHRPIQHKNGPLTTEIAILNLERMAHWNFKFISNKWKMEHTIVCPTITLLNCDVTCLHCDITCPQCDITHLQYEVTCLHCDVTCLNYDITCDVTYLDLLSLSKSTFQASVTYFIMHSWNIWPIFNSHVRLDDQKFNTNRINTAWNIQQSFRGFSSVQIWQLLKLKK